jgi:hypothetical protein
LFAVLLLTSHTCLRSSYSPPALACSAHVWVVRAGPSMVLEPWWWSEGEINYEVGGGGRGEVGRWEVGGGREVVGRYVGGREKFWGKKEVKKTLIMSGRENVFFLIFKTA